MLITVRISSYYLPPTMSLETAYYDSKHLKEKRSRVLCSWRWLKMEVAPELACILDEQIFGLPIVSGIGRDHIDKTVAK